MADACAGRFQLGAAASNSSDLGCRRVLVDRGKPQSGLRAAVGLAAAELSECQDIAIVANSVFIRGASVVSADLRWAVVRLQEKERLSIV